MPPVMPTAPLRVIHHLTHTDIARAVGIVAVQPGVVSLDGPALEAAAGLGGLVGEAFRPIGAVARAAVRAAGLRALHAEMTAEGRSLVLQAEQPVTPEEGPHEALAAHLGTELPLRGVLLVGHPRDGLLSWLVDEPATGTVALAAAVDYYCAALQALCMRHEALSVIRCETLTEARPDSVQPLLKALDLPFNPDWPALMPLLPGAPVAKAPAPVPAGLTAILNTHDGYHALCAALGYEPDPAGDRAAADLPAAGEAVARQVELEAGAGRLEPSAYQILKSEVELLKHELSIAQERGQLQAGTMSERAMSQLGQDQWVLEQTGYKRGGFFVEFGATDGIMLSNTWLLEKDYGWSGICAEPNPAFFKKLALNRSCTVVQECIGARTGDEVQFVFADVYGGMLAHAAHDQHGEVRAAYRKQGHEVTLATLSLEDLLIHHGAPRVIDYLSIDTEGSELEILETFPFADWDIRLITVEHNFAAQREKIYELLIAQGYQRTEAQWDDWYSRG